MNKDAYSLMSKAEGFYTFVSMGANGEILKAVLFQEIEVEYYNLVLLDYDFVNDQWSDITSSNNGDVIKIISTVVAIITMFFDNHPIAKVYFEGNTKSRNNLYQRVFENYLNEFESHYEVFGREIGNDFFERFVIGKKYNSFYICKK